MYQLPPVKFYLYHPNLAYTYWALTPFRGLQNVTLGLQYKKAKWLSRGSFVHKQHYTVFLNFGGGNNYEDIWVYNSGIPNTYLE